jgi:hypothetical protein
VLEVIDRLTLPINTIVSTIQHRGAGILPEWTDKLKKFKDIMTCHIQAVTDLQKDRYTCSGGKMTRKILFLCGMLLPFVYIFLYIIGGALRPGYSHISDSVSELLSPGAPNKSLLDIFNITFALLYTLFGIGVLQFVIGTEHNALIGRIGAGLIIAVGVASIGSAIFPQDATGTPATLPGILHVIFVFGIQIPGAILSTLLIGIWLNRTVFFPGFATYSFISVGAIVLSGVLAGPSMGTPIMGLVERISALAVHQWIFVFAWTLFRH